MLLKELAAKFQEALRNEESIARIGGDEFAMIFHIKEAEEPYENLINRLLKLASTPLPYADDIELRVSASIGISFYTPQKQVAIKELIIQADEAMYEAKKNGKNCFHVYQ